MSKPAQSSSDLSLFNLELGKQVDKPLKDKSLLWQNCDPVSRNYENKPFKTFLVPVDPKEVHLKTVKLQEHPNTESADRDSDEGY